MTSLLDILQVFLCVVLVFLILMHSGKDAGLSGAFGVGTGAGPFGGGSLVERNLNRWTIAFALEYLPGWRCQINTFSTRWPCSAASSTATSAFSF